MGKCVVNRCEYNKKRNPKNPNIKLHGFPKTICEIVSWLKQAQQDFGDLEEFANLIKSKNSYYRICSMHFTPESFIYGEGKRLKPGAIPTIFRKKRRYIEVSTQQSANQPNGFQVNSLGNDNKQTSFIPPREKISTPPLPTSTPNTVSTVAQMCEARINPSVLQTKNVPIKCEGVAASLSIEEQKYMGHTGLPKDVMRDNHQTLIRITTHGVSGLHNTNLNSVSIKKEAEDEGEETDIQQVDIHPGIDTGLRDNPSPVSIKKEDTKEDNMQQEEAHQDFSLGVRDNNIYTVSIKTEAEEEREAEDIHQVEIHSDLDTEPHHENLYNVLIKEEESEQEIQQVHPDPGTDGSMNRNILGQHHSSEELMHVLIGDTGVNKIYHKVINVNNKPCNNGSTCEVQVSEAEECTCSNCVKCLSQKSNLDNHHKAHLREKPFACFECGKCFSHRSNLNSHKKIHKGAKPFSCSECGKCFFQNSHLTRHQKIHTGSKPFACSECGKCFFTQSVLDKHQRIHTGEKPFTCPQCRKCFSSKSNLIYHQSVHTGVKPFSCSECGKCFSRKSNIITHLRTHTGEKPFACFECGKCFRQKKNLLKHQRVHTAEKTT